MRANEFLQEAIIRRKLGNLILNVSEHVQDRAQERGIPWHYVTRILDHAVNMSPKFEQMLNFDSFRLRDDDTWTELICRYRSTANDERILQINTVVRRSPDERTNAIVLKID